MTKRSLRKSCIVSPGALYPRFQLFWFCFIVALQLRKSLPMTVNIDQHYSVYVSLEIFLTLQAKSGQWDVFWEHWPALVSMPGVKYFSHFQQRLQWNVLLTGVLTVEHIIVSHGVAFDSKNTSTGVKCFVSSPIMFFVRTK